MKIYPVKQNCCNKSSIATTDDGNRTQYCLNCDFKWQAPEEDTEEVDELEEEWGEDELN